MTKTATIERLLALKTLYATAWTRALKTGDLEEIERCQTRAHTATKHLTQLLER